MVRKLACNTKSRFPGFDSVLRSGTRDCGEDGEPKGDGRRETGEGRGERGETQLH